MRSCNEKIGVRCGSVAGSHEMPRAGMLHIGMRCVMGRSGSYIAEAAITLPVFIIAVMVLCSVILMYACIEDASFIAASEMKRGAAESAFTDASVAVPFRIRNAVCEDHSQVRSAVITDYGYRVSRWGQDELMIMTMRLRLKTDNPIGIKASADYELSMVTRAYVGRIRDEDPMTDSEMSGDDVHAVYIFPARGEKYHNKGCGFLTAASKSGILNASVRKEYKGCPLCGSGKAGDGTLIYYFPAAGDDYHLPGCPALQRNYIEIDRKDAIARGYTACAKCGG